MHFEKEYIAAGMRAVGRGSCGKPPASSWGRQAGRHPWCSAPQPCETCTQPQRLLQSVAPSFAAPPTSLPSSLLLPPFACLQGYLYQLALTAGLQRARAAPAVAMSYLTITGASCPTPCCFTSGQTASGGASHDFVLHARTLGVQGWLMCEQLCAASFAGDCASLRVPS